MKKSFLGNVLVQNFLALSTIQIANLILPFITLPYLARVLGVSNYGVVFMVYSVMQLLFVLNDYGFNLSATKEVSNHRLDIKKVNEIFSSIISIKIVLLLITFLLLAILGFTVPIISEHREAYFLGFGMVIGQTFTPVWLFQGMERMKYITIVNLVSKLTFTVLIFIVIKESEDYTFVPLLYSVGFVIAGVVSIYLAKKEFGVYFSTPKWFQIKEQLNNSTQYFLSRASIAAYTSGNNFIVGIFLGEYYAGIFGVAEKLYMAMILVYTPLSDAIYPFMVKKRNIELFKKIFIGVILVNLAVITFTYFFSGEIVNIIFGDGYSESAELLKYFCFLALIIVPTIFIGYPLLGAFGYEKHANYSVVAGSLIHFLALLIIHPYLTIRLMVFLLIFTQVIVFSIRMHGVQKLINLKGLKSNN